MRPSITTTRNKTVRFLNALCWVCYVCVIHAAGQNVGTASSERIKQELVRLENEWLSTYVSGDKSTYDRIVADDFAGTDESAVLRGKADDRALLPSAKVAGGSAVNEDVLVRVYGKFAVVTGRIVTKFTAGERVIASFKTRFTDTWRKGSSGWQVIARHYSRYPPERTAVSIDPAALSELAGNYELAPGVVYEVSIAGGKILGAAAGQPKLELAAESEFAFFTRTPAALYLFIRDRTGKIGHVVFIQDGRVTAAKRIRAAER